MSVDIYADEYEPQVKGPMWTTYGVAFPRPMEMLTKDIPYFLYVDVDETGLIDLNPNTRWNGQKVDEMGWDERTEIYEFLVEWELAVWLRVGPEDRELFATTKLSEEYGLQ